MVNDKANLRHGPRNFHDDVFENEMNDLINITQGHYEAYEISSSSFTNADPSGSIE
jgi:hypothetical protein